MINIGNNNRSINNININNNINNCRKNFRTPLTPLHRGGLEGLHKVGLERVHRGSMEEVHNGGLKEINNGNNMKNIYKEDLKEIKKDCMDRTCSKKLKDIYSSSLRYAFSLIELSIVLIIIGLLVAGVTGGKSLIDSAKSRALINELREYERAVWTFRAARDRFPGDVRNRGIFGYWAYSSVLYEEADFPSDFITEFRKTAGSTALPTDIVAPFAELYIEGIIDFKPLGNSTTANKSSTTKGVPNSKVIEPNNMKIQYNYLISSIYGGTPYSGGSLFSGLMNFGNTKTALNYSLDNYSSTKGINPTFLKKIDEKIDDGEYWNGKMRGACYGSSSGNISNSYDNAIKNGKRCNYIIYAL